MTTESATQATTTPSAAVDTPILDGVIEGMAWLILGLAPLLINVYNVDAYRTIQATYSSIFIVILVAAWAISVTLTGRWPEIRRMPLLLPLSAFGVWALAFLATSSSVPVSGASWVNYVLYCLLFFALADLGARRPEFLWRLAIPLFLAFSFNCITGLMQHKGFTFLAAEAAGYSGLYQWWPIKTTAAANYFAGLQAPSRLHSAAGTLGNQNVLGGYLCATIPFFLILPAVVVVSWRNLVDMLLKKYKQMAEGTANVLVGLLAALLGVNALVSMAALLATDTRGAWLGVAASLALGVAVVPAFFREQLARVSRQVWLRLGIGAVIAVVAMGGLAFTAGVTPTMIQNKIMGTWTIKQRLVAWQVAAQMANDQPVVGQGLGTYKIYYFSYLAKVFEGKPIPAYMHHRYVQAHNDFVQLAAEMGWVGLAGGIALLGGFWFAVPRYIWRRRPPPAEGMLLLAALLGTFGMSVFAVSGFPFHIAASSAAWTAIAALAG
ncbi:MAG: O-antigen ligase family protein, partial [Candidatus Sericytochromatia bacterium]|nr:O-antigen ligase family protein [Candidatus Tanganyikabacteria bacterium]